MEAARNRREAGQQAQRQPEQMAQEQCQEAAERETGPEASVWIQPDF